MNEALPVNPVALREEVKSNYREVAREPDREYHFHTGRALARRLGYDSVLVEQCRTLRSNRSRGWQPFHSDLSSTAKGRYRPVDIEISSPYDTFGEARGEDEARLSEVYGYTFLAAEAARIEGSSTGTHRSL